MGFSGKNSGPLNHEVSVPILVVHSNSWSSRHSVFHGRPHFDVVRDLVEQVNERGPKAWFMTSCKSAFRGYLFLSILAHDQFLVGTTHPSVTDAPLIEPMLLSWTTGSTIDVKEGLSQYVRVTMEFLDFLKTGQVAGVLSEPPMSKTYSHYPWENTAERKVSDDISQFWQVHVAPEGAQGCV